MKTLRSISLCMLLALIVLVVPAAFAQEETFGLSEADFALFAAANAATAEVESFTFDFSASFVIEGTGEGDVNVALSGNGAMSTGDDPVLQLTLSGQMQSAGETQPLDAEVRIVDGMLYVNDGSGWKGQASDELLSGVSGMTGMDVDPEEIASGDLSDIAGMEGMADAMSALSNLDPNEFISMSRTDSNGLAQFTIDVSISDLLASPSLAPLFMMGMSGGMEGVEMDPQQAQAMVGMIAAMFSEATVSFSEYVDPATSLLNRAVLDINLPIPDMSGTGAGATMLVAINFDLSLDSFGEPVMVEAPADFELIEE